MGQIIDGEWVKGSVSTNDKKGDFKRASSVFRNKISSNHPTYLPETNRYHLYVSYACPWAHRTLIFRKLKNLENHISVDYVHPDMLEMGWSFEKTFLGVSGDSLHNKRYVHEIYQLSDKKFQQRLLFQFYGIKKRVQ